MRKEQDCEIRFYCSLLIIADFWLATNQTVFFIVIITNVLTLVGHASIYTSVHSTILASVSTDSHY